MQFFNFKSFFKYIVSLSLLVFLLAHLDFIILLEKAGSISVSLLFISLALILCQIFFLNIRWHILLNIGAHNIPFKISGLINIAGYLANILFITSVGGIIVKSGLAVRHGLSLTQAAFATLLDRLMTLGALIVLSALGLPFLQNSIDHKLLFMLTLTVTGVIAVVFLSFAILHSGLLKSYILSSRKRSRLVVTLNNYMKNYGSMMKAWSCSIVAQVCFVLCVYTLSLGIEYPGQNEHTLEFLALVPILALISSLPISFGGWGVREGAFIYGLAFIGFPMESAFLLSIQVGLITLVAPFLFGLYYLLWFDVKAFLLGKDIRSV